MKIYSTLSRTKKDLKPINKNRINLFVCGPTVYDDAHIGHGRTYIAFDTIKRYLSFKGYSMFYLQNITDIDDKIIKKANEKGVLASDIAKKYEKRFIEDMDSLNVNSANLYVRATDYIDEIINQISRLIEKGFAYETDDGVYFSVSKFRDFGKLSNRKVNELESHREIANSNKKEHNDFVLWKIRNNDEPVWSSPWGDGRPGWHIEDTAITEHYFGPQYDIHGGGLDLIFPHHEAEIAQIESVSNKKPMVNYWMHTGFLNVSGEKMSKSLNNFITIRDLLKDWDSDVFRFFVLSTHYRSPIDFSTYSLHQSEKSLNKIKKYFKLLNIDIEENKGSKYEPLKIAKHEFFEAMDNDFNTPKAISAIFNLINKSKGEVATLKADDIIAIKLFLLDVSEIFGIDFNIKDRISSNDDLLSLIFDIRQNLRENKQYELSDKIREELNSLGYEVKD